MRAVLVEYANTAFAIAKNDQVLAEQAGLDRRAIGLETHANQVVWCTRSETQRQRTDTKQADRQQRESRAPQA